MSKLLKLSAIVLALTLLLGCSQGLPPEKATLKFGTLPRILDLPLYVAQQEGFFQKQGIEVELVPFRSAMERDTVLLAGQIDGTLEDMFSAIILNKEKETVKVVAASPLDEPMVVIVASAQSKISSAAELKGVEIAVSTNTVMDYALDRLLISQGLQTDQIKKVNIPAMPLRLEMLNQGKVKAAVLTPPLSDMAILNGGRAILDDGARIGIPDLLFTTSTLESKPEAVRRFVRAWEEAAQAINRSPDKYRQLLVEVAKVPPEIGESLKVPVFPKLSLPPESEVQSRVDWMIDKGMLEKAISYQEIVNSKFLP